ncbi:hypothetical protein [Candidatus Neomicrothrix sp.]|jgi:hypothetical protein|uniref:hypothetical protein n=1 Tax=Candidatus Neomicrothrix sp. TaxID=2719034 RepID=UPI0016A6CD36|nr:hypothetical protein [Candidatus Microthrix sp.]NLH66441.1 hypothetical protein [Candidatus Microthrix parvicella]MBK6502779.1 hypothetical protein [Candidatus Microthrix sp.]MBK7021906.1 hypothetical protein [Candidatus Microthrix sp.]MBK7324426.1 hypothetical protein [Candidatus Microthrix sp.]MBP7404144.1 hypothetical protein [Candidatus Microthrix sp.]
MTSPVEHPGSPSSITAGLLASGFAQMPFVLSRSERNDLQSLSIDRWTRRSGPGASYLPDGEEPDHAFESLSRRLLGLVRVTALELAELGALPKGIAVGGAWHSSAGSYAAAPGVRLHPHHDVEVLTAIVAIGDGLEIAGPTASCDPQQDAWLPLPSHDGLVVTLVAGTLAQHWSQGPSRPAGTE